MKSEMKKQTDRVVRARNQRKRIRKVVSVLSAVAVFCTTYALILPAITWNRSLICEEEEHTHTAACYETVTVPAGLELVCEIPEHTHGSGCGEKNLTCTLEETQGHTHTEDGGCYESPLICGETESSGHTHTGECYDEEENLVCGLEAAEGHTHGDGCYGERTLACTQEEIQPHTHGDDCYETGNPCEQAEHTHGDDCYVEVLEHEEQVLKCGKTEHVHDDGCYDAPPAEDDGYYCGHIAHIHAEELNCFYEDGTVKCTLQEHVHTLACKSDPEADVESDSDWEASVAGAVLTGNPRADLVAVAKTQLGYQESTRNYEVQEDGDTVKGYTRYGDWAGDPYGDWDAMFCAFCVNYANVTGVPTAQSSSDWAAAMEAAGRYHSAGSDYEPKPGDLVFMVGRMGIACETAGDTVTTIEGDVDNAVCMVQRSKDGIFGYGELTVMSAVETQEELTAVIEPGLLSVPEDIEAYSASGYFIFYYDDLGRVIKRDAFAAPYTFRADFPAFKPSDSAMTNVAWADGEGTRYDDGTELEDLTANLNVYPVLAAGFNVLFDTDGGSAIPSQSFTEVGKVTKPDDPTKIGYTFGGWYADPACEGDQFDFDTTVSSSITIHAKWVAQPASYTVRLWLQQPGGDYVYGGDITKDKDASGNPLYPGAPVELTEADHQNTVITNAVNRTLSNIKFPIFFFDEKDDGTGTNAVARTQASIAAINEHGGIAADGSTVLNVYYRRIVFNFAISKGPYFPEIPGVDYHYEIRERENIWDAAARQGIVIDEQYKTLMSTTWQTEPYEYITGYSGGSVNGTGAALELTIEVIFSGHANTTPRKEEAIPDGMLITRDLKGRSVGVYYTERRIFGETVESALARREQSVATYNRENFQETRKIVAYTGGRDVMSGCIQTPQEGFDYYFEQTEKEDEGGNITAIAQYPDYRGTVIMIPVANYNFTGNGDIPGQLTLPPQGHNDYGSKLRGEGWYTVLYALRKHYTTAFETNRSDVPDFTFDVVYDEPLTYLTQNTYYEETIAQKLGEKASEFVEGETYTDGNGIMWRFEGWYDNVLCEGDSVDFSETTRRVGAEDVLFYAKWVPIQYKVRYDPMGGTIEGLEAGEVYETMVNNGTKAAPITPEGPDGDPFYCWTLNGKNYGFLDPVTEDITLRALYSSDGILRVRFKGIDSQGAEATTLDDVSYASGATAEALGGNQWGEPKKRTFLYWEDNKGNHYNPGDEVPLSKNIAVKETIDEKEVYVVELNAVYEPQKKTLTVQKQVVGSTTTEPFNFTATIEEGAFYPGTGGTVDGQTVTFALANGESVALVVEVDTEVTICEDFAMGYYAQFTDSVTGNPVNGREAKYTLDGDKTVTVTNTAGSTLPSTGGIGVYFVYTLGAVLVSSFVMYCYVELRKRERGTD